jgi:hypothetical protein
VTQLVSDLFSYSVGTLSTVSSGAWASDSNVGGSLAVVSGGEVRESTAYSIGRFLSSSPPSADYYSEVTIGSVVANVSDEGVGPAVRISAGSGDAYFAQCNSTNEIFLYRANAFAFTQLGSAGPVAAGDKIALRVSGVGATVALVVTKNGATVLSFNDSSGSRLTATGTWGIWASHGGSQGQINAFAGGDLASASEPSRVGGYFHPGRGPYQLGRFWKGTQGHASSPTAVVVAAPLATHTYVGQLAQLRSRLQPAPATHTYTAQAPQVRARVAPGAVTHTYTARAPQVMARVSPGAAVHTYLGVAPQVRVRVAPGAATHTYLGRVPGITAGNTVGATTATHSYLARAPQVNARVAPGVVSHTYTARAPQVQARVQPGAVTHTYTGVVPTVLANLAVSAEVATHSYSALVPTIVQGRSSTGAGNPKKNKSRRRKIIVEIDGQEFLVSSEDEAQDLLDQALELAEQKAAEELAKASKSRMAKSKLVRVVRHKLQPPKASSNDAEVQQYVDSFLASVNQIYDVAVKSVQKSDDDDDEFIVGLLM